MKNLHIIALIGLSSIALVHAAGLWDGVGNAVKSTGEFATNTITLGAYDRNKEERKERAYANETRQRTTEDRLDRNEWNAQNRHAAKKRMASRPMSDQDYRMSDQDYRMSNKDQHIMIQAQEANDGDED